MFRPLSDRQMAALSFIRDYIAANGRAPCQEEIGEAIGLKSRSATACVVRALESKGAVEVSFNRRRGITLSDGAVAEVLPTGSGNNFAGISPGDMIVCETRDRHDIALVMEVRDGQLFTWPWSPRAGEWDERGRTFGSRRVVQSLPSDTDVERLSAKLERLRRERDEKRAEADSWLKSEVQAALGVTA